MIPSVNLTSDPTDQDEPGLWVDLTSSYTERDLRADMGKVVAAGRGHECHVRYWSGFGFSDGDASLLSHHEAPETVIALASMARFVHLQNLYLETLQLGGWAVEEWVFAAVRSVPPGRRGRVMNSQKLIVPTSAGVAVWEQTRR